ncbi:hypothetical protein AAKU67_004352 [Oxalobacteraceae bacterium GrIS 2.11]
MNIPNRELHLIIRRAVTKRPDFWGDESMLLWERLSVELVPIIGDSGFSALYKRSLTLTGVKFPWILESDTKLQVNTSFNGFITLLKHREVHEATETIILLLVVFTDLLTTLIGLSLTTRILFSAWGDDAFDLPAPEQKNER